MNVEEVKRLKGVRKITVLTAYDYQTAKIIDDMGIDMILVGDSLGMVVLGYHDTKKVTMMDMIRKESVDGKMCTVIISHTNSMHRDMSLFEHHVQIERDHTGSKKRKFESI